MFKGLTKMADQTLELLAGNPQFSSPFARISPSPRPSNTLSLISLSLFFCNEVYNHTVNNAVTSVVFTESWERILHLIPVFFI